MKLKNKLFLPIILLIISFCLVMVALKISYQNTSQSINNKRSLEFRNILAGLIDLKNKEIMSSVSDNSYWDEMVDFLKTNDQKWLEDTILPSYKNYGMNYLLMYNKQGKLVREIKSNSSDIGIDSIIVQQKLFDGNISYNKPFYIRVDNNIVFVYATTVHFTRDEKKLLPLEGYLIGAKILDNAYFEDLSNISTHKITLLTTNKEDCDFIFPLKDNLNQTVGNIGVKLNSDLSNTIEEILDYQFGFIVLASLIFLIFFLSLVNKWVLIPIGKILNTLKLDSTKIVGEEYLNDETEIGDIAKLVVDKLNYIQERNQFIVDLKEQEKIIIHQSKMASLGEMISNIAHQWRQPLSVISTIASGIQMQQEHGVLDLKTLAQNMEEIVLHTKSLSSTIDTFRNFTSKDLNISNFSINQTIENVYKQEVLNLEDNNIKLFVSFLETDVVILGSQDGLGKCLVDMIENAKDVLLKNNSEDNRLIFLNTKVANNQLEIEIKDNGGGITEEIISKIFEPYFTTKHQSQGTGISLYMHYKLILDQFKGLITVKNISYQYNEIDCTGACFTIYLPLQ